MTSFVDDNGNYLDYSGDDFTLTKQAISIFDLKIKGDVSVNFNLDNNSVNRKTLGFYGPQQISSPVLSKIDFNLVRNGNQVGRGYVVVQRITEDSLDCYFIMGNSGWFADMQFNIQELDLNDFVQNWTYTAMVAQKSATSGIIFPLIDVSMKNQRFYQVYGADSMYLEVAEDGSTEQENRITDFYPCFYLKNLIDRVSNNSGFKFSGNLFDDAFYKTTIITPPGGRMTVSDIFIKQRETLANLPAQFDPIDPFAVKTEFKTVYTGVKQLYSNTNFRWTADGKYPIRITVKLTMTVSQPYNVYLYKNGALVAGGTKTFTGTVYIADYFATSNPGDYYEIWTDANGGLGAAYFIAAGSSVLYTIADRAIPNYPIIPNSILPTMKAIDLIKAVSLRFGCVITLDNVTKTIALNQIDKITASEDWSDYLKSYQYMYEQGFKNNYITLESTPEFETYNLQQTEGYGGANLETDFDINQDRELYSDPFGAALDEINLKTGMLQPFVELVSLADKDNYTVTSVTNFGGYASFTVAGFPLLQNGTIIRSTVPSYLGYHIVSGSTATAIRTLTPYTGSDVGVAYTQDCSYADTVSRLMTVIPNYDIPKIGPNASIDVVNSATGHVTHTTWPFAYFNKPTTGKDIDQYKQSLSYGPINASGYSDQTIKDAYYKSISTMLNGPIIRCKFVLPEAVFYNYNFDRKIYLNCKDFSGYFWVNRFSQYKDSKTEVEVDLLFMQ